MFICFEDYHDVSNCTFSQPLLAVTIHMTKKCKISITCCEFSTLHRIKDLINKGELKNYLT